MYDSRFMNGWYIADDVINVAIAPLDQVGDADHVGISGAYTA